MQDGFDVDDRRAVDGFERPYSDAALGIDLEHGYSVQADGVGPVRGAGGEDSCQRVGRIIAWIGHQDVAVGTVEPCEDDDRGTACDSLQRL